MDLRSKTKPAATKTAMSGRRRKGKEVKGGKEVGEVEGGKGGKGGKEPEEEKTPKWKRHKDRKKTYPIDPSDDFYPTKHSSHHKILAPYSNLPDHRHMLFNFTYVQQAPYLPCSILSDQDYPAKGASRSLRISEFAMVLPRSLDEFDFHKAIRAAMVEFGRGVVVLAPAQWNEDSPDQSLLYAYSPTHPNYEQSEHAIWIEPEGSLSLIDTATTEEEFFGIELLKLDLTNVTVKRDPKLSKMHRAFFPEQCQNDLPMYGNARDNHLRYLEDLPRELVPKANQTTQHDVDGPTPPLIPQLLSDDQINARYQLCMSEMETSNSNKRPASAEDDDSLEAVEPKRKSRASFGPEIGTDENAQQLVPKEKRITVARPPDGEEFDLTSYVIHVNEKGGNALVDDYKAGRMLRCPCCLPQKYRKEERDSGDVYVPVYPLHALIPILPGFLRFTEPLGANAMSYFDFHNVGEMARVFQQHCKRFHSKAKKDEAAEKDGGSEEDEAAEKDGEAEEGEDAITTSHVKLALSYNPAERGFNDLWSVGAFVHFFAQEALQQFPISLSLLERLNEKNDAVPVRERCLMVLAYLSCRVKARMETKRAEKYTYEKKNGETAQDSNRRIIHKCPSKYERLLVHYINLYGNFCHEVNNYLDLMFQRISKAEYNTLTECHVTPEYAWNALNLWFVEGHCFDEPFFLFDGDGKLQETGKMQMKTICQQMIEEKMADYGEGIQIDEYLSIS